jgi:peptidoglycan/xylan/chitin deacetylase (PgdA/CDA1 family)
MLTGKDEIKGQNLHLSFDDGFRNNYINAFPVLKKLGIPAIFFIPPSLIETDRKKISEYSLITTKNNSVLSTMKWGDVSDIISNGYEIGSHSMSHTRLSEISKNVELLENEIIGSKLSLEKKTGVECKYISWPFGKISDIDKISISFIRRSGYSACFGGFRGSIVPGITDVYFIPRHHFEVDWPMDHIKYFSNGGMEYYTRIKNMITYSIR